ncbi:hypothetical protein PR048_023598, partial [Dryococelus australis]
MHVKSGEKDIIISYLNWFKTQTGKTVKGFISDNGLEEFYSSIEQVSLDNGIVHEKSCPYTPKKNGKTEFDNRTVVESLEQLCELKQQMQQYLFSIGLVVLKFHGRHQLNYFFNRNLISFLKPCDCEVFVHIPEIMRKKLNPKAKKGIFVGYDNE